jgi:porin
MPKNHHIGLRAPSFVLAMSVAAAPALGQPLGDEKDWLIGKGVTPSILYSADIGSNLSGGKELGSTYSGSLHVQALFDGGRLFALPGLSFFVDILNVHGAQPSRLVGDAQGISNIAATPALRSYEVWAQFNSYDGRFSLLAGRYDLGSEFYRLLSATLFLNGSFGVGADFAQSGRAGPSIYPDTAAGLRLTFKPTPGIVLRTAVLDGAPLDFDGSAPASVTQGGGALIVSEIDFLRRPGPDITPGTRRSLIGRGATLQAYEDKIAVGGWYYTSSFSDLSEVDSTGKLVRHAGSGGAYLLVDKRLYEWPGDSPRRVSAFFEGGIGDDRANRFGSSVAFGLTGRGLISGRPDDELGIGAAIARNSAHFEAAQFRAGLRPGSAETSIDMTYLCQATDWFALQPDLQYVVDPGTDPRTRNAVVFQLQFEVSL